MCQCMWMECRIDTDIIERIYVLYIFLVELCRIGMGCFTSIFVSHMCGERECSIEEALFPSNTASITVVIVNAISFLILIALFMFELYRENWLITNFDKDESLPENNLTQNIAHELQTRLIELNRTYWRFTKICCLVFLCNTTVTGVFMYNRYRNYSTLTAFMSFTLLLFQKVYYSFYVSKQHFYTANSAFMTIPHTFNAIDKDYNGVRINGKKVCPSVV